MVARRVTFDFMYGDTAARKEVIMSYFPDNFLIGAATAAHQVEGNNVHSDFWATEQLPHTDFAEPSLAAVDHYNRYEEDIALLAGAGLNVYRFSIEWARIEPEKGKYDENEIEHYRKVLACCGDNGVTPIVTMHHFSSPKWLISEGGWENEALVGYFKNYCVYAAERLGDLMEYVCTINEANMGLQIRSISEDMMRKMGVSLQVGLNMMPENRKLAMREAADAFGIADPMKVHTFLSLRTDEGDRLIMRAHEAARDGMKAVCPRLKVGLTLSLYDIQTAPGGEEIARAKWNEEFRHYLPYLQKDDFLGLQNYTRKIIGADGALPPSEDAETTQMGYEFYPESLGNVIRTVAKEWKKPIIVTENGLFSADDTQRVEFLRVALEGVKRCVDDGLPVKGYCYWSLLDNFEWQLGFAKTSGLIAVERPSQKRFPKESLSVLGAYVKQ
jgi:beta-glucosidase